MSSNRHLGRIIALQTLYEHEFRTRCGVEDLTSDSSAILQRNLEVYQETLSDDAFARDLVEGTLKHYTEADALIAPAAPEWPIDQIATMDLTILRLALYELIKREVPPKVVINEAVELAKAFGGENSSKFINGVLGTIYRQSEFYDATEDHKVQREQAGPDTSSDASEPGDHPTTAKAAAGSTSQRTTSGEESSSPNESEVTLDTDTVDESDEVESTPSPESEAESSAADQSSE